MKKLIKYRYSSNLAVRTQLRRGCQGFALCWACLLLCKCKMLLAGLAWLAPQTQNRSKPPFPPPPPSYLSPGVHWLQKKPSKRSRVPGACSVLPCWRDTSDKWPHSACHSPEGHPSQEPGRVNTGSGKRRQVVR